MRNRTNWRKEREAAATKAELDKLYQNDLLNHNPSDPYCICNDCMGEAFLKAEISGAAEELRKAA